MPLADDPRASRILHGPIARGVLMVALPSVATMLLQTLNGFLDRFFVGDLGTAAMAAVSLTSTLLFTLLSAAMAISVGASALIARFTGARTPEDAVVALRQSLLLSIWVGGAISLVVFMVRRPLLAAQGLAGASLDAGEQYLAWTVAGLPFSFLVWTQAGAFRGLGDTVRPFWVTLGSNLVHAGLNYLLIPGNHGFPRLGIVGGAIALSASQAMAVVLQLIFLRRTTLAAGADLRARPSRAWMARILRVGLPAGGQQILRTGSMLLFQNLLARNGGDVAVAALGVGLVAESIAFMPGFGYSIAASAFVGQNLGAGNPKRAARAAWSATGQSMMVMTLAGLFVHTPPGMDQAARMVAEEQVRLVVLYLRIAAVSEPFLALGIVLSGALQGAGETVSPTILVAVCSLAIRLPLGWFLLGSYGVPGAWWSMSISTIIQGVATLALFHGGRWAHAKV